MSATDLVFPSDSEYLELHEVAWEAYLFSWRANNAFFEVLQRQYAMAVDRLGNPSRQRRHVANPEERLAQHLVTFYWQDILELEVQGSLLDRFFAKASDRIRGKAFEYVGRSLDNTKVEIEPSIIERLVRPWTWRIAAGAESVSGEELASFGWWFVSDRFNRGWALDRLNEAVSLGARVEPEHVIVEKLRAFVDRWPLQTLRCLGGLVDADREGWRISAWRDDARAILQTALRNSDLAVHDAAVALINRLAARGNLDFKDLLE
jgi:hypothetical protein